jgi:hypothetical protein
MKYMITWRISPSRYREAVERFLRTSAPDVDGVTTLGRWHLPGSSRGWHLVEGTAEAVVAEQGRWYARCMIHPSCREACSAITPHARRQ